MSAKPVSKLVFENATKTSAKDAKKHQNARNERIEVARMDLATSRTADGLSGVLGPIAMSHAVVVEPACVLEIATARTSAARTSATRDAQEMPLKRSLASR